VLRIAHLWDKQPYAKPRGWPDAEQIAVDLFFISKSGKRSSVKDLIGPEEKPLTNTLT
jgi:hypothetical protein